MPDKKLTDNEIVKALECCKNDGIICFECPYKKTNGCMEKLSADTLDLINRLQVRVEKLEKVEHFADKTIATLQAENEKLNKENENLLIRLCKKVNQESKAIEKLIKAEAYKEFAEKLHEELRVYGVRDKFNKSVFLNVVDKAKKELVGE